MQRQPFEMVLDQTRLARRIGEMGREISRDYEGKPLVLLGVLKGCMVFIADLVRHITIPVEVEFICPATSRSRIREEGDIIFTGSAERSIRGRHVLLVEGIVDTCRTASIALGRLRKMEPASVEIVTLLDKPGSHREQLDIKYKGFSIGNDFVIGFGMDNAQKYRNLPFIGRVIDS
ncbi:MAG: hypoxanthine phosphoribosyltransferase [Candidatus Zixiibacteriota bacterium]